MQDKDFLFLFFELKYIPLEFNSVNSLPSLSSLFKLPNVRRGKVSGASGPIFAQ